MKEGPLYLKNYEALWREDPKAANMQWFKDEKYGLFIHYGLYSLLHQKRMGITVC